jgi:hypothetical protein
MCLVIDSNFLVSKSFFYFLLALMTKEKDHSGVTGLRGCLEPLEIIVSH